MKRPLRLGMVGCGGISHAHAKAASNLSHLASFVACCDIRREAADEWAARYGAEQSFDDLERMLGEAELDGVLIATWPNFHRQHIETCLSAGVRNILCEKALTLTGEDAVAIWDRVHAADAFLMEGFMYRHHPLTQEIDRLLAQNEVGQVDSVVGVFSVFDPEDRASTDDTRDWRQRKECGGGVPYDYTCYPINGCGHYIRDLPVRAFASGAHSAKYGVIHRMYGMIEYAHQQVGVVKTSRRSDFSEELHIYGSGGLLYAQIAWTPPYCPSIQKRRGVNWPVERLQDYPVAAADPYQCQLENFCRVTLGEAVPGMPLIDSVVNTFTIEALVTSLVEKRAVEIGIPDRIVKAYEAARIRGTEGATVR